MYPLVSFDNRFFLFVLSQIIVCIKTFVRKFMINALRRNKMNIFISIFQIFLKIEVRAIFWLQSFEILRYLNTEEYESANSSI